MVHAPAVAMVIADAPMARWLIAVASARVVGTVSAREAIVGITIMDMDMVTHMMVLLRARQVITGDLVPNLSPMDMTTLSMPKLSHKAICIRLKPHQQWTMELQLSTNPKLPVSHHTNKPACMATNGECSFGSRQNVK